MVNKRQFYINFSSIKICFRLSKRSIPAPWRNEQSAISRAKTVIMYAATTYPENTETDMTQKKACRKDIQNIPDNLLDGLQSSVIFFDAEGVVFRTNGPARADLHLAEDITGCKLTEVLSLTFHNKNILPDLIAGVAAPATGKVAVPKDTILNTDDGNLIFFITGTLSRLDGGSFMFSFRNVADEMTNDSMVDMALRTSGIFPWFYDFGLGAMVIDPRYYEYTGIPTEDGTMTMEEYSSRLHPEDRQEVFDALAMQLNGEHYPYRVSFRLRRGDDSYEWFEAQSTYLGEVNGKPYRIVGICMSAQAHKDIEEALTDAKNKAEQSDRLKSAFLANMSHEIRTPLNAIVGFSNLLAGGEAEPDSEEAKEYAALISRNCDHLLTLVSDILDLSRIESESIEYNFAEYALGQLLRDIYVRKAGSIPRGVDFNLLLPPNDIKITTDTIRLRQVVEHLVGNSVKFTSRGHIDLGYSFSSDGESVRIFVADTGCGIPADQTERIFERFYKVDDFAQGAGLGLSICRTIIEHLGGTVSVSSRLKAGARFTLKLPVNAMKNM